VVDEADKAPTHVTAVLKSLVEDREMLLADGRRLADAAPGSDAARTIPIHPVRTPHRASLSLCLGAPVRALYAHDKMAMYMGLCVCVCMSDEMAMYMGLRVCAGLCMSVCFNLSGVCACAYNDGRPHRILFSLFFPSLLLLYVRALCVCRSFA
jgi:hypothetical protein